MKLKVTDQTTVVELIEEVENVVKPTNVNEMAPVDTKQKVVLVEQVDEYLKEEIDLQDEQPLKR